MNFFNNLPVQQRNFLQYGAFGAGSTKDTVSWSGFVLASFGDTTFHALQEDTHANIPPRGFVFGFPASLSKECARFCKIPPKIINFIQNLVARILTVAHLKNFAGLLSFTLLHSKASRLLSGLPLVQQNSWRSLDPTLGRFTPKPEKTLCKPTALLMFPHVSRHFSSFWPKPSPKKGRFRQKAAGREQEPLARWSLWRAATNTETPVSPLHPSCFTPRFCLARCNIFSK